MTHAVIPVEYHYFQWEQNILIKQFWKFALVWLKRATLSLNQLPGTNAAVKMSFDYFDVLHGIDSQ